MQPLIFRIVRNKTVALAFLVVHLVFVKEFADMHKFFTAIHVCNIVKIFFTFYESL